MLHVYYLLCIVYSQRFCLLPALFLSAVWERRDRELWRRLEVFVVAELGVFCDAEPWQSARVTTEVGRRPAVQDAAHMLPKYSFVLTVPPALLVQPSLHDVLLQKVGHLLPLLDPLLELCRGPGIRRRLAIPLLERGRRRAPGRRQRRALERRPQHHEHLRVSLRVAVECDARAAQDVAVR